jgi:23S rRNA (cytidine1920-2'-O)/16S rRNA (cytidine1409-2'-O)-methyltransferase
MDKNEYVGRGALKIESVAQRLNLDFKNKNILDVGSSTGGFTEFALKKGAKKVIAVDLGVMQLHDKLRSNPQIELHEKTDIRDIRKLSSSVDIVLIDVSFVSLREILPSVIKLISANTEIVALCKPQFESNRQDKIKGIIKNDSIRRGILKDFENWAKKYFVVLNKADSLIHGSHGNKERFYLLKRLA